MLVMHEKRCVVLIHVQDCRGEESKKDNVASEENSRGQQLTEQLEKCIGGKLLLWGKNRAQLHDSQCFSGRRDDNIFFV